MATEEEIFKKLEDYKEAVKVNNFDAARNRYEEIVNLINDLAKNNSISKINAAYFKVQLLKETKGIILNYQPGRVPAKNKFFQDEVTNLDNYLKYYWKGIDEMFLPTISTSLLDIISSTADEITHETIRCFKLFSELEKGKQIGEEEYAIHTRDMQNAIEKGKGKLETIMPLFSIWGLKGEAIDKRVSKNKYITEKSVSDVKEIEERINRMGLSAEINRESRNFNLTAGWHFIKGLLFLAICFGLGLLTIVWALGITEVWGIGNPFISSNKVCSDEKTNFYLCKLANLPKELLVGAVLFAGIYASLRAYFGNANSEAVNRHRFNALQAYKYLYKFAEGNDKNLVMQKATEAIFEQVPTGFTKYHKENNKSSDSNTSTQLALMYHLFNKTPPKGDGS